MTNSKIPVKIIIFLMVFITIFFLSLPLEGILSEETISVQENGKVNPNFKEERSALPIESPAPSVDPLDSKVLDYINRENISQNELNESTDIVGRNFRVREEEYLVPFGKRPFGPSSRFKPPSPDSKSKWVGYFCEETFIPVLQHISDRTMVDCTVIEVNREGEQESAMKFFGQFMEMVPLSLKDSIHVISLCGMMQKNRIHESYHTTMTAVNVKSARINEPSVILPGTLWCGLKDKAQRYEQLGDKAGLDSCCRTHDHCPMKVGSFVTKYGVTNYGVGTSSHCLCDLELFNCLKQTRNPVADMVGNLFFNVLRMSCIGEQSSSESPTFRDSLGSHSSDIHSLEKHLENPYECISFDNDTNCRYWRKKKDFNYEFTKAPTTLKY